MKPALAIIAIGILILSSCVTQPQAIIPIKYTSGYLSDKDFSENNDSLSYDTKSKLLYKVLRDTTNIYIRLVVTSEDIQQKILQKGMTIWFDTTNTNQKIYGISFPKEGDYEQLQANEIGNNTIYQLINEQYSSGMQFAEIKTSPEDYNPQMCYTQNEDGLNIELKYDSRLYLCYELQMPISMIKKSIDNFLMSILIETGKFSYNETEPETPIEETPTTYSHNIGQSLTEYSPLNQSTKLKLKNIEITKNIK